MKEFVLDASFALLWCFEYEATEGSEIRTYPASEPRRNSLGTWHLAARNAKWARKGVARGKVEREKAFLLWREMREMPALPVHIVEMPVNETLLDLALKHNLALYDASYLSLALLRKLPIATANGKLKEAWESVGLDIIEP